MFWQDSNLMARVRREHGGTWEQKTVEARPGSYDFSREDFLSLFLPESCLDFSSFFVFESASDLESDPLFDSESLLDPDSLFDAESLFDPESPFDEDAEDFFA